MKSWLLRWLPAFSLAALSFSAPPVIDKTKLEAYLRYAEGFMTNVHFTIEEPEVTGLANFYRVRVHLSTDNGAKLDRTYLMTADGQQIVNGTIWDLKRSPFADMLTLLPRDGYSFGPADAKVQMVVYSDFQCPYCREFAKTVRDNIPRQYPKDVRVIFQDFPLDALHPWARAAAEASHCVADQNSDAFWSYHDWIFAHGAEIKPENLKEKIVAWAKEQKLEEGKVGVCMDSHAKAATVTHEEATGKLLQVQQTPTSFVNGRMVAGAMAWANLDSVIQLELKRPASVP